MRRVVVTGLGAVSPCGNSKSEILENLEARNIAIVSSKLETTNFYGKVSEECLETLTKKEKRYMDKASQFAIIAAREAVTDSNIDFSIEESSKVGVSIGTAMGGFESLRRELVEPALHGLSAMSVLGMPKLLHNLIGTNISMEFGCQGGVFTYNSACASSAISIGEAANKIKNGELDIVIAGGVESCIFDEVFESFNKLGALSKSNKINEASIPFSNKRTGFVLSEGASILILEDYEHALSRGAEIYCELTGYGYSSDAKSLVSPDRDGIVRCLKNTLRNAGIKPEEVEYINAHGTSTEANDMVEAQAIEEVFGIGKNSPYVASTKSIHGHLLGAAGSLEAMICCLMISKGSLFPQINVKNEDIDQSINLNLLLDDLVEYNGGAVMSNSFAFGGINASLIFSKLA